MNLEDIYALSRHFITIKNQSYKRYFIRKIPLKHRLSILLGQRGVGKTTMLIQYLLDYAKSDKYSPKILYVQADHFLVANASLYEIAEKFYNSGGKFIVFDEIHKYPNWSIELKSIYDTFPDLKIIASGSSALEVYKGSHDLSRRAIIYNLPGLSLREYLELNLGVVFADFSLQDIVNNHEKIADSIITKLKPQKILLHFHNYLKYGYYPYFQEIKDTSLYLLTLEQNLHTIIESDLAAIYPSLTGNSIKKIKQLLVFIAQSVPFVPNWQKIKILLEIGDDRTLKTYFKYLEDAGLTRSVMSGSKKMHRLEVSGKIYLNNSNQLYAFSPGLQNQGTMREIFFLASLSQGYKVTVPQNGDFLVDDKYIFEIGGKKKSFNQIKAEQNAYLACDDIESGSGKKIPLWLFGFLY